MKIIHCADIHLDSKIESNLPQSKSKQRKNEILLSFCDMVDFATSNEVTAVIIAGDLFDSDRISPITRDIVLNKIAKANSVDFLYLTGNHDAGKQLLLCDTPDNLKFFSDSWTSFDYGNVTVTGAVLTQENCRHIYSSLLLDQDRFNIVTLHGGLSSSSGEQSVNEGEISDRYIDYLALGHYHKYSFGTLGHRGEWCYSGCLEGRGFDECGDKGFVLLDIDNNKLTKSFIKCSHRDILTVECDISGLNDSGSMLQKINDSLEGISDSAMVKVVLLGELPQNAAKDINLFLESLNKRFYFAKVADRTRLYIDPKEYMSDVSLKGEFIRLCLDSELDEESRSRIIECGLAALGGREVL